MSFLALQHAAAVVFFLVLLAFELLRHRLAAGLRHPLYAYLVRGAIAAAYFALFRIDPVLWLTTNVETGVAAGAVLALLVALARRADARTLATAMPAMVVQAAYLAVVVAAVEELVFRGAFVLVAAVTPLATLLASLGSSVAYAVWRAFAWRERDAGSLALVFVVSVGLGLATGLTRSLWPGLLAHAAYVLLAGPPRPAARLPRAVTGRAS